MVGKQDVEKDMEWTTSTLSFCSSPLPAYVCALQKEVPYHGRLYISDTNACFYSSVLLKDTKVDFSFAAANVFSHKNHLEAGVS